MRRRVLSHSEHGFQTLNWRAAVLLWLSSLVRRMHGSWRASHLKKASLCCISYMLC